eukprot:764897-Hanusia_phi.AAC.1
MANLEPYDLPSPILNDVKHGCPILSRRGTLKSILIVPFLPPPSPSPSPFIYSFPMLLPLRLFLLLSPLSSPSDPLASFPSVGGTLYSSWLPLGLDVALYSEHADLGDDALASCKGL